jgi:hypothetical protein
MLLAAFAPCSASPLSPHLPAPISLESLDRCVQQRSEYFGVTGNSAETLPNNSGVVPSSSSSPMLTTDQPTVELANGYSALAQINETEKRLTEIFTAIRDDEDTDVEEIVKLGRTQLPPVILVIGLHAYITCSPKSSSTRISAPKN